MKKIKLAYVHNIPPVCLVVKIKSHKNMQFFHIDNYALGFPIM